MLNLTRSAFLGQQRYGTVTWSGDVSATWDTLRRQIADGLNFCATGMPYWTTDVGGVLRRRGSPELWFWAGDYDAGVDDLGYRELYVRWFQYAALLPMLRSHGTDTPREIWRFGEPGDADVRGARRQRCDLRYRLLPYIYSLAGWTTQRAYTMLRSLPFDFRDDPAVHDVADQFMFGPAFLVCPVHEPMAYGPGSTPLAGAPRDAARLPARRHRLVRLLDRPRAARRAGRSRRTPRSSGSPSSSGPARSCRWDRSASTLDDAPGRARSSCTSTPGATPRSASTRTRATAMGTRTARSRRSTSRGTMPRGA